MNGLHISILSNFFASHNVPSSKSKIFIDILNSGKKHKSKILPSRNLQPGAGGYTCNHVNDALVIQAVRESRRKEWSEGRKKSSRKI